MLSTKLIVLALVPAVLCWSTESGENYYNIACPGETHDLVCPLFHRIQVRALQYGVKTDDICYYNDEAAAVKNKNCLKNEMLEWSRSVCDGRQTCTLPKPSPMMFRCDYSPNNFVQVVFGCKEDNHRVDSVIVCEGKNEKITCDYGFLHIVRANFGRLDEAICTDDISDKVFCMSAKAGPRVKALCNNRKSCNLSATKSFLGTPSNCDNQPFYLEVHFYCS